MINHLSIRRWFNAKIHRTMEKKSKNTTEAELIRQKAEEQLQKKQIKMSLPSSEGDLLKLLHEFEVHQIELEMQNDELRIAQQNANVAEEKYTELYDFAPSGYLSLSKDGKITELNFAAARILGKERLYLIERQFTLFVSKDTLPDFNHFFQNVFSNIEKQTCEVIIESKDNAPIYLSINGIISKNGQKCFLTLSDITASKNAEIELIKAKKHAEKSDYLKTAFLANMSHEIRTPMNGILGFAQLLKEPDLTKEELKEYVSIIEKSGARMLNIVNDIIDITKIEAGLMELDITETDINEQIEYIYDLFKPEVEAKGMNLLCNKRLPAKDATIKTDREKVYAILTNLVKNAFKYSIEGSIEIGCILRSDRDPAELEFFVKDTGIGIPKDRHEAIFERFVQADTADKMSYSGAGLGLSITKSYVEMLGGRIWLESEEEIGSTFYFTLLYNAEPKEKSAIQKEVPLEKTNAKFSKLKILIAEDDEISEKWINITVKMLSKEILNVSAGNEAVETCRKNPDIDLVLMDVKMPEMSGYEAARKIREFNNEVVIIAQTAYGLYGEREIAIEAGCNDYISKPIDRDELLSLIQKYFGKYFDVKKGIIIP
ncbi:MAG: hybrid sensor histidine kinase/response regulator [Bacteroidetes bacterium HGW-Bacteroidetes-11]|nr:MAG: hybrid sensor histidine kinase/response regulator [Bacteroidetes bacterium HGW-Bacteroidetes-11]